MTIMALVGIKLMPHNGIRMASQNIKVKINDHIKMK